jgi:hypothetical protein
MKSWDFLSLNPARYRCLKSHSPRENENARERIGDNPFITSMVTAILIFQKSEKGLPVYSLPRNEK